MPPHAPQVELCPGTAAGKGRRSAAVQRAVLAAAMLAALAVWPARLATAQGRGGAVLLGRVTADSTNARLPGARVSIPSIGASALTDSLGRFRFIGVPAGRRGLRVDLLGYAPLRTAIEFSAGDTIEIDIGLSPSSERLDAVEVVAMRNPDLRLADFERRRASGTGEYLTADDIHRLSRGRLSDALQTLRGVRTTTSSGGTYLIGGRASGNRTGTCFTAVMLDGSWVYDGDRWQTPFNVNSLVPGDIAAVEFYRGLSNTPVELQGSRNSCGVLVVWTAVSRQ